tara:strand:+ start:39 stop:449 length:411 start_codon:yes stop_codon:yes gene_type:complete
MSKQGTIHLTYWREYYDSEESGYDAWFKIYYTIFRNVPLSQLKRLNSETFKNKVKNYCDKNYTETASNATGESGVDMIHGSEYYYTYGEEFNLHESELDAKSFITDYGQKYNTRQFFKHDFMPEFTKQITRSNYDN